MFYFYRSEIIRLRDSISNVLLICKIFFHPFYDISRMGRKPKARRDPYGAWLLHLREEKGLTQHGLAKVAKMPQRNIAYWERTGKLKGRKEILALAEALGVSVTELLRVK